MIFRKWHHNRLRGSRIDQLAQKLIALQAINYRQKIDNITHKMACNDFTDADLEAAESPSPDMEAAAQVALRRNYLASLC